MTTTTSSATTVAPNIPLTTLFSPPAWCDSHSWVSSDCPGTNTCTRIYNIVRATETECYPSGWQTSATYFSPGICPSGYSTGTNQLNYFGASGNETRTETWAKCCPSGYTIATETAQDWYTLEPCIQRSKGLTTITYTITGITPFTTKEMVQATPLIHAIPIEIAWQSTDMTPTPTPTVNSSSAPKTDSGSGLSAGAKAGIAVGVSVGVIAAALAFGAFFWFRRKRHQDSISRSPVDNESTPDTTRDQDFNELATVPHCAELPADPNCTELPAATPSSLGFELEGDQSVSRKLDKNLQSD